MPRSRSRKTAVEPELLPPEDNQPSQKVIKHKTEWTEVVEEAPGDTEIDLDDAEIGDKPRKRNKNAIQEMRKKLRAQGVTPTSNLRLYIERYVHSETDAGGSWAETEFCTKYSTTEEHIFNKDYIDAARKWGPGKYRITIRMDNRIVDAFDERISATPSSPVIQHVNPNDPTSPQVIYQPINGDGQQQQQYQPMTMKEIMKARREAFEEELKMRELERKYYGLSPETPVAPQRSEEEVLTSAILQRPEVLDNVVGSVMKRFGGKGGGSDEPWYADAVKDAIRSGQGAQIVKTAIDALFNGFKGLFPGGQNNGQSPATETQTQTAPVTSTIAQPQHQVDSDALLSDGVQPVRTERAGDGVAGVSPQDPYAQMLTGVISTLISNGPVEDAIKRVDGFLLMAPQYTEVVDNQFSQPAENLLGAISTIPGCEQIAQAEHAKGWIESFQAKFFAESEGEDAN